MEKNLEESKGGREGVSTQGVYSYDQEIALNGSEYTVAQNGGTYVWSLRTPAGTMTKVRMYRDTLEDPDGQVRLYFSDREQYATAPAGDWVQIPGMQTDAMTTGDMMNGTITFRAHLEVEPVPVG